MNMKHDWAITAGTHITYWIDSKQQPNFPTLSENKNADVLVIGWGIAGLTTAYKIAKSWKSVILVEDWLIWSWESWRTTAHLSYVLGQHYYEYEKVFDFEKAKMIAESHQDAIDEIEKIIKDENIDCDFLRTDGYLFLHETDKRENLEKEFTMTQKMWLPTKWLDSVPWLKGIHSPAIKFPHQWQFHVMKYLHGLAKAITNMWWEIFTYSRAKDISAEWAVVNWHTVTAQNIVVATNSPVNDRFTIHSKQFPYRTYVIWAIIDKWSLDPLLWRDTWDSESIRVWAPYRYIRTQAYNDTHDLLIVWWEDHKVWQADHEEIPEEDRYIKLITRAKQRFPHMMDIVYRWSGQVLEPADYIAFIGKNPGDENIYIITGDSWNGMTHGTLWWMIVSDLIDKKKNKYMSLYSPSRMQLHAWFDYVREMLNLTAQYGKWLTAWDRKTVKNLKAWDGAVLRDWLKKLAVYRDDKGKLHVMSAVCPHLWWILVWNNDEKSFDCPVHGSRFTAQGKAINWPTIGDLEKMENTDMD